MKTKLKFLFLLALGIYFKGAAQMNSYDFKRSIETPVSEWHSLRLPVDLAGNSKSNLSDIRIYGLNTEGDTLEIPYLLVPQKNEWIHREVSMKILNQVRKDDRYYFTFEVPSTEVINKIVLNFDEQNFNWEVDLEGSQDLKGWEMISEKNRMVDIHNSQTNYTFSTLQFEASQYHYYRISMFAEHAVKLLSAQISREDRTPGKYYSQTSPKIRTELDKKKKNSIWYVDFEKDFLFSQLSFTIDDAVDYYRPFWMEYLTDSTQTEKDWIYHYRRLSSGFLSSWEEHQFEFPQTKFAQLRITIDNQDNAPLSISSIAAGGYYTELLVRFSGNADYYLCYGKENDPTPSYDLAKFRDRIPKELSLLQLGKEERQIKANEAVVQPLFANKIWLWLLVVVIILVLGGFTLKMMRNA